MRFINHVRKVTVETPQHKLSQPIKRLIRAVANRK